ncbi:MAG: aminotransferase class I/II-fold pyridoxal phosphate-dependent enzyme [Hyphomicrobiaceae bacterium]|nr:aminotransferase class I/II-fold pyridoxal phosphate-dependent enzyme [Hyphomicrobiaceae bacterium]
MASGERRDGGEMALLRAAAARSAIAPFIVMDVMRQAAAAEAAGRHVVHMEVGQPATAAPLAAREAARRALESHTLGYTLALGMEPLRERIARLYRDWYGIELSPERVVVTSGSSAAFVLAFLALFEAGAKVALPAPGYPCYRHILTALDASPVMLETGPNTRWMPTAAQIEEAAQRLDLAGLLIASPANPTGTMLEPQRLAEITAVAQRRKLWFVSDEIYHGLTWGLPQATALQFSDDVVVINSFSKYFSMTGWRVGWMVVPPGLVRTVERLAQNLYISPPAISQVAALGAFDGLDELERNRKVYAANRALLLAELPKAGLGEIVPADGAFYLYVDVSRFTDDSLAFTRLMLDEAGVAATPGVDFDEGRGRRFVRFSYAGSTEDMAEAARRLQRWKRLQA